MSALYSSFSKNRNKNLAVFVALLTEGSPSSAHSESRDVPSRNSELKDVSCGFSELKVWHYTELWEEFIGMLHYSLLCYYSVIKQLSSLFTQITSNTNNSDGDTQETQCYSHLNSVCVCALALASSWLMVKQREREMKWLKWPADW